MNDTINSLSESVLVHFRSHTNGKILLGKSSGGGVVNTKYGLRTYFNNGEDFGCLSFENFIAREMWGGVVNTEYGLRTYEVNQKMG